jgi:FkbM family methyltransferase
VDDLFDMVLAANASGCESSSQLKQDIFALVCTGFKRNGFFVEFGATNGMTLSNTLLLERQYGWSGILAEPAKTWHDELAKNRTAALEFDCLWSKTGQKMMFSETAEGELSTLSGFSDAEGIGRRTKIAASYEVNTISLNDLLVKHNAPHLIDYLSIDTEGSEYEILNAFDFSKHTISVITCEHNFTPMRSKIHDLLSRNGYRRVLYAASRFDDWYIKDQTLADI